MNILITMAVSALSKYYELSLMTTVGLLTPYLELIYSLSKCIRKRFCLHLLSLGQIHTDVYIYTVLERGGKSLDGIN